MVLIEIPDFFKPIGCKWMCKTQKDTNVKLNGPKQGYSLKVLLKVR